MTPEQWQCVNELYHEAQACAPPERATFLRSRCAGDEAMFREVTSLLNADEKADGYLVTPALELEAKALATEQQTVPPLRQLGHYEILAPLGAGGMGEVWRARDTRLGREVALKTLPLQYTLQPDRLRRFVREAQTASALNHPNILTVYDIGQVTSPTGELHFIATELLEGTDLRQLLAAALPLRTALDYARQIAAGLVAAHEKGIVHRDLKPENLFVTHDERVKILDFGLAKLIGVRSADLGMRIEEDAAILTQSPDGNPHSEILNPNLTNPGTVLGTVSYMSPEQVRGEEVNQRSDLFSFGLILHEMLTGQRVFQRASTADTMVAILKEEPPELGATNPEITPHLAMIVRHCLEKKAELRFQSARDLSFALETLSTPSGARSETSWPTATRLVALPGTPNINIRLGWMVAAAILIGMLGFAFVYFRRVPAARAVTITYLPVPENTISADVSGAVFSPDGRQMVTTAVTNGVNHLWLYSLGSPTPRLLPGTEGGHLPFWSPNGQSIGFFDFRNLKRMELTGSIITTLCPAPIGTGGAWNRQGDIIFATQINGSGLYRVADTGGTVTPITSLNATRFETGHNSPCFLPDGRHFIFFTQAGQPDYRGIQLGSLDNAQTRFLLRSDAKAEYSAAGFLLFVRGRKILAQPFDSATLTLSGEPLPITTEQVYYEPPFRYADLSVVSDQLLLYRSGGNPNTQLTWFDRSGKPLADVCDAGQYRSMQLSPDGEQVLLDRNDPQMETSDIWKFDLLRQTGISLTSNPGVDTYPIWSPDGSRMVFVSNRDGVWGIYEKSVHGDDNEKLLLKGDQQLLFTSDWSPDGKFVVYRKHNGQTRVDIELLPLAGDHRPRSYLATPFTETYGSISPDGRWLAYQSDASDNRLEIYVQSFPEPGRKIRVSQGGGQLARWRRDGKELYYVAPNDKLMAVPVQIGANFAADTPVVLFDLGSYGRRTDRYMYDVSADGRKFLVIRQLEDASMRPLTVVQNWMGLLKK